jgi:hypothetical protein
VRAIHWARGFTANAFFGGMDMNKLPLNMIVVLSLATCFAAPSLAAESAKSSPKDTNNYSRPAISADTAGTKIQTTKPAVKPQVTGPVNIIKVIDAVVNNTDPNLKNTDTCNDGETSIAINPLNSNEIVISAFSGPSTAVACPPNGSWIAGSPNAPVWHSTDNGQTWTKLFTVPFPPGVGGTLGCPCDQTFDYGADGVLFGVFLTQSPDNVYSGSTGNPNSSAAWAWWTVVGVAQASNLAPTSVGNTDQPWLLHNRGTTNAQSENVYVAYDDFGTSPPSRGMRVSASINNEPPQFTSDQLVGSSASGGYNPGHRLAGDPRNGWMYSLHQNCITNCANTTDNPKTIQYILNRSTDQGTTWGLNSSPTGIVVATADSTQPEPKFGTVNALLGGVDHAAVDPETGDVYVVYGNRDASGNNRLAMRRLFDDGTGSLTIGPENFVVAGTVQAALPSVAVTREGSGVGVFYYTYNGMVSGFPQFTTWLAVTTDQGATFNTQQLATFLSPATDNGNGRQRVFGDYVQMKAVDFCFDGSFTGNGAAFGRSIANNDPIFFQACVPPVPFSAITAKLSISSYQPLFNITINFTLGANSNGINPLLETVTLQINNFSVAIPPGSFVEGPPGTFTFSGLINGVNVTASIVQTGPESYTFKAKGNPNLSKTKPNPATVTLTIGNDSGTTSVKF